ncbi:four helix bundle protein [Candidatus Uhrbacteria bacterium]|nr:four helix bundle protein [Candidatus Uhrbacteria bacterium]
MQYIEDTPVFQKSYDLYRTLYETIKKYPKMDRHALGEKTKNELLDLISAIGKAGREKKDWKARCIEEAINSLELVKILVRLGFDTKCLHQKQYIEAQERMQEIGRMLGGWKRSI